MRDSRMREADTALADEIVIGGQPAGKMSGFRFAAAPGSDAAAEEARAALAGEYALRAERFAAAPNADISLAQDGSVRWRGHLIAKLKAAEDILRPGFALLADAGLAGEALEKAQARLSRFIAFHFETVCKPLYDLAAAEALFEKPRFVAEKIVAHLGVVPRREIAVEIKALEQESRAALRRLGVRFGVYHIFMPMLLKPAAAQGLTLLWALKHDALERPGYGEVIAYLAAGRTSFAVEEQFDRQFYRLAGYRLLGKKAVRIDMLERCADLIRQALAWSPAAAAQSGAPRPEGAYDGRHFTISQAMLSILGATPENMEEMLKQLGYAAHSISAADYAAFLGVAAGGTAKSGGNGERGNEERGAALPAAEPVGDWPQRASGGQEQAEQEQAERGAEQDAAAGEAIAASGEPAAEPVGPKFSAAKTAAAPAEDAVVLLWRYQKHSRSKAPHREGGGRRQKRAAGEAGAAALPRAGGAGRRGQDDKARPRGHESPRKGKMPNGRAARGQSETERRFDGKKHHKPIKAEDSPFAALLALRDKMKK